ncbi:hypothetical protein GTW51_13965 [Aurantimonas aggregata]|uniref:EamA family transporter n=1 Tax=Aurantimonas aggregata TaxID=2047720 RepID=A0A6L9MJK6_9HYPH|nr:hypothetical protein [Aurantimonas aggregata]NDV87808.1 hypothetical protein [Aurantimonas aggregata]
MTAGGLSLRRGSTVAPFERAAMILPTGYVLFGEALGLETLIGGGIAVSAGITPERRQQNGSGVATAPVSQSAPQDQLN